MDEDVRELPRILWVGRPSQFILDVFYRSPVSVVSLHRADVVVLNLEAELIVHLISLNES